MRDDLERIIADRRLSASAKLDLLLERLLDPTPAMILAMETIEADFGEAPDGRAIYQAAVYECLQPRERGAAPL